MIVLNDEFYREISSHPIPTDLEAARYFLPAPRRSTCSFGSRIAVLPREAGRGCHSSEITVSSASPACRLFPAPKFREKLEGWLNPGRAKWPECPAVIDSKGTGLWVAGRTGSAAPHEGTPDRNKTPARMQQDVYRLIPAMRSGQESIRIGNHSMRASGITEVPILRVCEIAFRAELRSENRASTKTPFKYLLNNSGIVEGGADSGAGGQGR